MSEYHTRNAGADPETTVIWTGDCGRCGHTVAALAPSKTNEIDARCSQCGMITVCRDSVPPRQFHQESDIDPDPDDFQ